MKFTRRSLSIPYIFFLILFVIAPLLVLIFYAFTDGTGRFTLENFTSFFTNPNALGTLVYSFALAIVTTAVSLLLAYPIAYLLGRSSMRAGRVLLLLFILPMWINFSLRITALKEILDLMEGNLAAYPFLNAVLGETYDFLPFMILPIYNNISHQDPALSEAAADLGATPGRTFLRVTLPLSMPGVMSGISMVFLPAMTNYVVLDMLYNKTYIMGSLIGSSFASYNWHNGSMIALILLGIICFFTYLSDAKESNGREAIL